MADRTVQPGWYGYDFSVGAEATAFEAFRKANRATLKQRRTWSTADWVAVLIELTAPLAWTYPGALPKPAPKGMATSLQDLTGEPDVSPGLAVMAERAIDGAVRVAGGASTTIVIAAAAVALVYLLSGRR
jgi:hypothetical protein